MIENAIKEDIIISGFGGQGVMLLGKIVAQTGMLSGLHVTWIPKYGAEVRGGTAHCMVKIANEEIASPLLTEPSILVVMNKPSLLKFESTVRAGGHIIYDSSLCTEEVKRTDVTVRAIPATKIANKIGDVKGANMVMLGAMLSACPIVDLKKVVDALNDILPVYRHKYIPLNEKALYEGYNYKS